ncbi:MAG: endopeptidase La [Legionellales bacterium]|nr:endopeptidase La [Legionellales bacterium]
MSDPIENPALELISEETRFPALPLRDLVVFPHMVVPLFVGRKKSILALDDSALQYDKKIFLAAQKNPNTDDPSSSDLYEIGCIANILQMLKLPDGTIKVLVEGIERAKIVKVHGEDPYISVQIERFTQEAPAERDMEVLTKAVLSEFEQYLKLNKKIPPEAMATLLGIADAGRLADSVAAHMPLKVVDKQKILAATDIIKRVEELIGLIQNEVDLINVENRIKGRVKRQMEKKQREYYLNEQIEAIKKELGELEESGNEQDDFLKRIESSGMSQEAMTKAKAELNKLKLMPPMSAEATVSRNYLDTLLATPWKQATKISHNLEKSESILEHDHYGLKEVKERIIEYLAVQKRVRKLKGPVLCLVGPPGVGKTSLGESIARATGRKFVRVSLGGVRDEAEIRGHRRTYIGALPGKIIQKLSKVGVKNPLFLLDEVDKMSTDFRGDPSSALLEVLDPEQNNTFNDHYLEVDYDLSNVMFVCTANTLNIPPALLDRMEVIRIPGYTEDEKVHIAEQHLIPKDIKQTGLKKHEIILPEETLRDIVRHYTREAGVRSLEREIAKICRKVVKRLLGRSGVTQIDVTPQNLEDFLGVRKFRYGIAEERDQVGQVTGLAWTEVGGELLTIEAAVIPGKGKTSSTGHLGDVMQESIQAAMTVVRSRARQWGILPDFYDKHDIHVHVPEGATPKDGPSAGIAMCTALVSALTSIPVKASVAMTGEITLRGEVLPIGGLKEKLLAAHRGGIKTVIIPIENRKNLKEIPENITGLLDIRPVRWIDEVLAIALQHLPEPLPEVLPETTSLGKDLPVVPTTIVTSKKGRAKKNPEVSDKAN